MAVLDVKYDWTKTRSSYGDGRMSGQEVWTVQFDGNDNPRSLQFLAKTAPGIPRYNTSHPWHPWYYVQGITAAPLAELFWETTVSYGALTAISGSNIGEPIDPQAMLPQWSWPQAVTTERIDRDVDGDPITNSAGESPDPPMTEEFHDFVGRVVYYRTEFDPVQAWQYRGAINEDEFQGFEAEKVLCTVYSGEEMQTPFGTRYRIVNEFRVRWDGWKRRFRDEGFRDITNLDADGKPEQFTDQNGIVLSEPTALDGSGGKLADGAAAVFIEIETKRKLPFSILGLG